MLRSPMWTSVIQAVALSTLTSIIGHHLFTAAFADMNTLSFNLINPENSTVAFEANHSGESPVSYYISDLPWSVFRTAALAPLKYLYNIWLERTFPARPKRSPVPHNPSKAEIAVGTDQNEDEIINKWISRSEVHRSSISWRNTLLKWLVDLTFGSLLSIVIGMVLGKLFEFRSPSRLAGEIIHDFREQIFVLYVGKLISTTPLVTLIGFLIVPAYKRIVFEAGMDLLWNAFFGAFLRIIIPWFMSIEGMRDAMINGILAEQNASLATMNGSFVEHEL